MRRRRGVRIIKVKLEYNKHYQSYVSNQCEPVMRCEEGSHNSDRHLGLNKHSNCGLNFIAIFDCLCFSGLSKDASMKSIL